MANSGGSGGNSSGVRAGRAFVEIGTSDKGLFAGLDRAAAAVRSFGAKVAGGGFGLIGLGSAVLGPLGGAFAEMVNHFSEVNDAADRLGTTTDQISALGYAADQTGASMEDVESASKFLMKSIAESGRPMGTLTEEYMRAAEELSGIDDAAKRSARALELFGKNGLKMLPMLKDGAAGLKEMLERAELVGDVVNPDDAAKADRAGDLMLDLWKAVRNTIRSIPMALLPYIETIQAVTDKILGGLKVAREWIKANGAIVVGVALGAAAVVALGGAIVGVGTAIAAVGMVMSGVAAIGAAILTPAGLLVGIFAGLTAALVYFAVTTEEGRAALAPFVAAFQEFADVFGTTYGGILDALKAGDLELAAAIAFAGLEVAWRLAVVKMQSAWDDFKHFFTDGWKSARLIFETSLNDLLGFFEQSWIRVLKAVNTNFHKTFSEIMKGLGTAADALGDKGLGDSLRFLGGMSKGNVNSVLGAAGRKLAADRQKEEDAINARLGVGGAGGKSPALLAAEAALAAARGQLDDLTAEAFMASLFGGDGKKGKGLADIINPGLTRGTFATRGFGAQAFGGTEARQLKAAEKSVGLLEQIRDGVNGLGGKLVLGT